MARRTASNRAWNLPPIRARSPLTLCQFALEQAGEGEQVVALVLQGDAHRADAPRVLGLAGHQLCNDEVEQLSPRRQVGAGQGQDVMAQPLDERSDVAGEA